MDKDCTRRGCDSTGRFEAPTPKEWVVGEVERAPMLVSEPLYQSVTNPLIKSLFDRYQRCLAVAAAKNADYAASDDPFANFRRSEAVGVSVARGILVRLTDKIARISNLLDKPPEVADERLGDSIDDAINYLGILGAWVETMEGSDERTA